MENLKELMKYPNISQRENTSPNGTHLLAYDLSGKDTLIDFLIVPKNQIIKCIDVKFNKYDGIYYSFFEFQNPIKLRDNSIINKLQMMCIHSSMLPKIGDLYYPGQAFYSEGSEGNVTGNHVHIEFGIGYQFTEKFTVNKNNVYVANFSKFFKIEEIFYLDDDNIKTLGINFLKGENMEKRILVVCGHGQGDSGAVGNGYQEQERVRFIGKKLVTQLNLVSNIKATLYDTSKDLFQQGNMSEVSKNYDEVIELHLNSYSSSSAHGTEVLVFLGGEDNIDRACLNSGAKYWYNRGFKDGSWVYNAVNCNCAYRLVEFCFVSNKEDINIFNNKTDEIVKEYTTQIAKATGGTYNTTTELKDIYYCKVKENFTNNTATVADFSIIRADAFKDDYIPVYSSSACTDVIGYVPNNETITTLLFGESDNSYINKDGNEYVFWLHQTFYNNKKAYIKYKKMWIKK